MLKVMKSKLFLFFMAPLFLITAFSSCKKNSEDLWNGKDFSGWHFVLQDSSITPAENWQVKDGVIHCEGKTNGYMRTEKMYENYELTVEWRWAGEPGNSGVLINMQGPDKVWPNCLECQLWAGNAGDFVLIGQGSITVQDSVWMNQDKPYVIIPKMRESSEKPAGEWNRYRILNYNNEVTCYVNDVLQNSGTNPSLKKGYICLQSEGAPIEFRNIRLVER
jgi:hypothetical protein